MRSGCKFFPYKLPGWKAKYRRYLGFLPVQFCFVCDKWYWAGFPRFWLYKEGWQWTWMPWWQDYCSSECCEIEMKELDGGD